MLKGEPHDVYSDNRSDSLENILKALSARYGNIQTISDHLTALENIRRAPNESIGSVMQRVSTLLDHTKLLNPKEDRETCFRIEMKNYLLRLCSAKAKQSIQSAIAKNAKWGYHMEYKQLLDIAKDIESTETSPSFSAEYSVNTISVQDRKSDRMRKMNQIKG